MNWDERIIEQCALKLFEYEGGKISQWYDIPERQEFYRNKIRKVLTIYEQEVRVLL